MKDDKKLISYIIDVILNVLLGVLAGGLILFGLQILAVLQPNVRYICFDRTDNLNNSTVFISSEDYTVTFSDNDLVNVDDITEEERPCIITVLSKKEGIFNSGKLLIDSDTQEGYVGLVNANRYTEIVRLYKVDKDEKELIYQTEIKVGDKLDTIKLNEALESGNHKRLISFKLDDDDSGNPSGDFSIIVDITVNE